jgi:hypothetical protein
MDTVPRPERQRGRVVTALLAASLVAGIAAPPASATPTTPVKPFGSQLVADHPWVVAIEVSIPVEQRLCTGEILSPTKVLTAAACTIPPLPAGPTTVIAGRDNPYDSSSGFVDGVASVWTDPQFDEIPENDVQVLTLTRPLPSVYTPIGLSAEGDDSPYALGTTGYMLSYGTSNYGPNVGQLIELPVTTVDPSNCTRFAPSFASNLEVCTSYPGGGAPSIYDQLNLGSPLVIGGKLAGVGDELNSLDQNPFLPYEKMSFFNSPVTQDLVRPDPSNEDWTGDGISDVFSEGTNGQLTYYQGYGAYPLPHFDFVTQKVIDQTDWNADPRLLRVTDWNNDGTEGLLTVNPSGVLTLYPSTPTHGIDYAHAVHVGTGWGQFSTIVATNNFTGDGRPDLLAVRPDGTLRLYERTANGWVNGNGVQIGVGFDQFSALMPFYWTDHGHIGLLGLRRSDGALRFYETDGSGNWADPAGRNIGGGFTSDVREMFSVGSFGGTDTSSIMTVDNAGNLTLYIAGGDGVWANGIGDQIGVGFQTVKTVF